MFHDVAADGKYMGCILKGVSTVANVGVKLNVCAEVFPDRATQTGRFVQPDGEVAVCPHTMAQYIATMARVGAMVDGALEPANEEAMQASGFKKFMGKVCKELEPSALKGVNIAGKAAVNHFERAVNGLGATNFGATNFGAKSYRKGRAVSFGDGAKKIVRKTGFSFPIVHETVKDGVERVDASIDEVVQGAATKYPWAQGFDAAGASYTGVSDSLAFFAAYAKEAGLPIARGIYTGEVLEFEIDADAKMAYVTIAPVDECEAKSLIGRNRLHGVFVEGFLMNGGLSEDIPADFFGPQIKITVIKTLRLGTPYPEGAKSDELMLSW